MCYSCLHYLCSYIWIFAHIDQEIAPYRKFCFGDCWSTLGILSSQPSFLSPCLVAEATRFLIPCPHCWKSQHRLQFLWPWTESMLGLNSYSLLGLLCSLYIYSGCRFEFSILYLGHLWFVHHFEVHFVLDRNQPTEAAGSRCTNSKWVPNFYPKQF